MSNQQQQQFNRIIQVMDTRDTQLVQHQLRKEYQFMLNNYMSETEYHTYMCYGMLRYAIEIDFHEVLHLIDHQFDLRGRITEFHWNHAKSIPMLRALYAVDCFGKHARRIKMAFRICAVSTALPMDLAKLLFTYCCC